MIPFYCGYCSRWVEGKHQFCPTCGRPQRGRMCRRCKKKVPSQATHCPSCGGNDRLTEPAVHGWNLNRKVKLTITAALVPFAGLAVHLLIPLVKALLFWGHRLLLPVVVYASLFWLLTAILPRPAGQKVRHAVWWILRQLVRFLGNLIQ